MVITSNSRYTYRHFHLLRQSSVTNPLRVIAHLDLDAFYAQCEVVRLGTPRNTPLAVQQWESLIAINYPARPFGVTRMLSATEAKKRCPDLVLQHVATFREGEGGRWAYRDDAATSIRTDKVSLDPYRAESLKILAVIKYELSSWRDRLASFHATGDDSDGSSGALARLQPAKLEKASIDEVFIDLSPLIYGVLFERYPELRNNPSNDDKRTTHLPKPPTTALEWDAEDGLVDLDENEQEEDDPDWDDVAMLIGAEILRSVRTAVQDKLQYTCSGGLAKNKMMAKLGSACNKPNKQTIIRNRAIQMFLGGFKFTKIRMLGGKLGDQVTSHFGTDEVSQLLKVTLEQMKAKLDDDTSTWLYNLIRGEDTSEVNTRTQIKSMLSAKSFRPSINSVDQAEKWLHIFAADLYNRLVEDGLLENRRRPKTITLHHRQSGVTRSKQLPIPTATAVDETVLFGLSKTLLSQVASEAHAWPCANLSLSVGGFENGVSKNRAIDSFLLRGRDALAQTPASNNGRSENTNDSDECIGPPKRKRDDEKVVGIHQFFRRGAAAAPQSSHEGYNDDVEYAHETQGMAPDSEPSLNEDIGNVAVAPVNPETLFFCDKCHKSFPNVRRKEHEDWHFAKSIEDEELQAARMASPSQGKLLAAGKDDNFQSIPRANAGRPVRIGRTRGQGRGRGHPEKGQTRLSFSSS